MFKSRTLRDYVAYSEDGSDILEFDVAKAFESEVVKFRQEAVKAWLREEYVRVVAEIENAAYGWLWFAAVLKRHRGTKLGQLLTNTTYSRLARLVLAVDYIVKRCEEITPDKMWGIARKRGLRVRKRDYAKDRYHSDYEILKDTFDIIQLLNKMYRERSVECMRKPKKEDVLESV